MIPSRVKVGGFYYEQLANIFAGIRAEKHAEFRVHQKQKKENDVMQPTVGRMVYFYEAHPESGAQPHSANIIDVHAEAPGQCVSLQVFYRNGRVAPIMFVVKADYPEAIQRPYWDWMPFQKGQAGKTEELEQKLAETSKDK